MTVPRIELRAAPHVKRGVGVAACFWGYSGGPPSTVIVKLFSDGSANLNMGASDIGTGTKTWAAMIVAEELGVPLDQIQIEHADTGTTQYATPSGGSKTVPTEAPTVRSAAIHVKQQLLQMAADDLGLAAADLRYQGGEIVSVKDPSKRVKVKELSTLKKRGVVVGVGYRGPNPEGKIVNPFAAQFCEVEVNTRTGETELPDNLRMDPTPSSAAYHIIQFSGPIRQEWLRDLRRLGVEPFGYLPDYAMLAKLDPAERSAAAGLPDVHWVGVFQPAYKVQDVLLDAAGEKKVVVLLMPNEPVEPVTGLVSEPGSVLHDVQTTSFGTTITATVPTSTISVSGAPVLGSYSTGGHTTRPSAPKCFPSGRCRPGLFMPCAGTMCRRRRRASTPCWMSCTWQTCCA
mgnify:CR=1 FL=1